MNFFRDGMNEAEIKTAYRALAMLHHPDHGGNVETMQVLNAEYEQALKAAYRRTGMNEETVDNRWDLDAELVAVAEEIYKVNAELKIEVCGVWLWITGATWDFKNQLKALNCRWSPKKGAWYFRRAVDGYRRWHRRSYSLDEIRNRYGSESVKRGGAGAGRQDEEQGRRHEQGAFAMA